jgi:hypothetical protein
VAEATLMKQADLYQEADDGKTEMEIQILLPLEVGQDIRYIM